MRTTVMELIEALQLVDPNAEIRVADTTGYRSHFEYRIEPTATEVYISDGEFDPEAEDEEGQSPIVYLELGYQIGYLPSEARAAL